MCQRGGFRRSVHYVHPICISPVAVLLRFLRGETELFLAVNEGDVGVVCRSDAALVVLDVVVVVVALGVEVADYVQLHSDAVAGVALRGLPVVEVADYVQLHRDAVADVACRFAVVPRLGPAVGRIALLDPLVAVFPAPPPPALVVAAVVAPVADHVRVVEHLRRPPRDNQE